MYVSAARSPLPAGGRYFPQPVRMRDGRSAWIRAVRVDDATAVGRFVQSLSPSSRYFRFMMGMRELSDDALRQFTRPVTGREGVLVATPGADLAKIVALAQFVIDAGGEDCEVALVVADAWQQHGLGTRLLAELSGYAALHGVRRIHADVLTDNQAMRRLAEKAGFELRTDPAAPFVMQMTGRLDETSLPSSRACRAPQRHQEQRFPHTGNRDTRKNQ